MVRILIAVYLIKPLPCHFRLEELSRTTPACMLPRQPFVLTATRIMPYCKTRPQLGLDRPSLWREAPDNHRPHHLPTISDFEASCCHSGTVTHSLDSKWLNPILRRVCGSMSDATAALTSGNNVRAGMKQQRFLVAHQELAELNIERFNKGCNAE